MFNLLSISQHQFWELRRIIFDIIIYRLSFYCILGLINKIKGDCDGKIHDHIVHISSCDQN